MKRILMVFTLTAIFGSVACTPAMQRKVLVQHDSSFSLYQVCGAVNVAPVGKGFDVHLSNAILQDDDSGPQTWYMSYSDGMRCSDVQQGGDVIISGVVSVAIK